MSAQVQLQTIRDASSYPFVYAQPHDQVHAHAAQAAQAAPPATQVASYQQVSLSVQQQQHEQQQPEHNGSPVTDANGTVNDVSSSSTSIFRVSVPPSASNLSSSSTSTSTSTSPALTPSINHAPYAFAIAPANGALANANDSVEIGTLGVAGDKSRWSTTDDVALADALVEQKRTGRSRETIFSADAWTVVGALFVAPGWAESGGPKTLPQCKARWQRLKIEYRIVKQLRSQPGFSWDKANSMVAAPTMIWDTHVAQHREMQPWRKKSFPAYVQVAWLAEDDATAAEELRQRWEARVKDSGNTEGDSGIQAATAGFTTSPASTSVSASDIPQHPFRRSYRKRTQASQDGQSASTKRTKSTTSSPAPSTPQAIAYASTSYTPVAPPPSYPYYPYSAPAPAYAAMPTATASTPGSAPTPATTSTTSTVPANANPSRMALAIQTVEVTEGLADHDFVQAVRLFQRRAETPDAYLAIQSRRARSLYLRAELDDFGRVSTS